MARYPAQTILVVEDHTPVRRLISRTLTHSGFATIEAGDGHQALSLFESARGAIDLAIIDMVMPNMSGLDVAAELERQNPALKILYISGCLESLAIDCIRRRSPEFLLLKPFTGKSLVEKVADILRAPPTAHHTVNSTPEPT